MSQLNGSYHVHDSTFLWKYLQVKFMETNFETISYIHIPRSENHITNALEIML